MPPDLLAQVDIAARLIGAAILGGLIGLERELHRHPAGMRTHLLVALGSGAFTVLSMTAFGPAGGSGTGGEAPAVDASRVAAQIVSGIGFLGAGAILKYGTTIKGLTTAASLWATAAVGMAAGAGAWLVAAVATLLALASLWPLHAAIDRVRRAGGRTVRLRLAMDDLGPLATVTGEASNRRLDIEGLRTDRAGVAYEIEVLLRLPAGAVPAEVIAGFSGLQGVTVIGAAQGSPDDD